MREITPEHITEEIYPNRPEPVEFKVREEEKKDSPFVNPYAEQNNGVGGASPYANNIPKQSGGQSPYAGPYVNNNPPQNNPNQNQNPYANNGNFTPYTNTNQNANGGSFGEFWKKHWLFALVTLLIPFFGFVWLGIENKNLDKKYRKYVIILIVLGFITKI